jgi:hypothetical protein
MRLLVVLQCAYGTTARRRRQLQKRRLWLAGLWNSHTGRRLRQMLPEISGVEITVINASPQIGRESRAAFPPDGEYIQRQIARYNPDYILGCGHVAQRGLAELGIEYIPVPHPAWRGLTQAQTDAIRARLERLATEADDG